MISIELHETEVTQHRMKSKNVRQNAAPLSAHAASVCGRYPLITSTNRHKKSERRTFTGKVRPGIDNVGQSPK